MIEVYFDGSCWPNPGDSASCGVLIRAGDETLLADGFNLDDGESMSSNLAEYAGLIIALERLKQFGYADREIVVKSDSQLAVLQMQGKWKIKQGLYVDFAHRAKLLAAEFKNLSFEWIPREYNEICDSLAGNALQHRDLASLLS